MGWLIHGAIVWGSYIALACVAVFVIFGFIGKYLNKKKLKACGIIALCSLLCLYAVFYGGEYRRLRVDTETKERLLNINIDELDFSDFILEESYVERLYSADISDEEIRVTVTIGDYYGEERFRYSELERIFEQEFSDEDSTIWVGARSSDRDFGQIPLITSYQTELTVIQGGKIMEINYWSLDNSCDVLNEALDKLQNK